MDSIDFRGTDRISFLPVEVRCRILSFLNTKDAVATSILSTRWKNLCSLIPNVDMSDIVERRLSYPLCEDLMSTDTNRFVQFVSNVLMVRSIPHGRDIPMFRLHCDNVYDQNTIDNWILLVLQLNVQELDLWVKLRKYNTLPSEIFQCVSLEVLKLGSHFHLNVLGAANLPKLKELNLEFIEFGDEDTVRILLSSCPVLEDLRLFFCRFRESDNIEIAHPLLKKLMLTHAYEGYYVIFDTPNIQNLYYNSYGNLSFSVKNIKSLAHAHIEWGLPETQLKQLEDDDSDLLFSSVQGTRFINEMHKVRSLYLDGSSLNALYFSECAMVTFHNLTVMELGCSHLSGWLMLPVLLAESPNLEVLIFSEGFIERDMPGKELKFYEPVTVPACFFQSLKQIMVANFDGLECELVIVEYFLKSVQVLKKMMIGSQVHSKSPFGFATCVTSWNGRKEPPEWVQPTCKRLFAAPRRSKDCQIMISWDWEEGSKIYQNIILN